MTYDSCDCIFFLRSERISLTCHVEMSLDCIVLSFRNLQMQLIRLFTPASYCNVLFFLKVETITFSLSFSSKEHISVRNKKEC